MNVSCECVMTGHPDKLADQIADIIVDQILEQDHEGRCGIEVQVNSNVVSVSGEIKAKAEINVPKIVKDLLKKVGYSSDDLGTNSENITVMTTIREQSSEISRTVDTVGKKRASDQGVVFGYATNETQEYLPMPLVFASKIVKSIDEHRLNGKLSYLRPDGKSQVTIEYDSEGNPMRVDSIVVSAQHNPDVDKAVLQRDLLSLVHSIVPSALIDKDTSIIVNRYGVFTLGGPRIDTGVTGRKIVDDTYGGVALVGGGALSGKDPTKLDRSGAYYGRYIAKHIVAAGLAKKCQIQISYAFGEVKAISTHINTFGTSKYTEAQLLKIVTSVFSFDTYAMIDMLSLRKPIYFSTATYGQFMDSAYPWEQLLHRESLLEAAKAIENDYR